MIRPHIEKFYGPSSIPRPAVSTASVIDYPTTNQKEPLKCPYFLNVSYSETSNSTVSVSAELKHYWEDVLLITDFPRLISLLPCIGNQNNLDASLLIEIYMEEIQDRKSQFLKDAFALWMYLTAHSIIDASSFSSIGDILMSSVHKELDYCIYHCSDTNYPPNRAATVFYRLIFILCSYLRMKKSVSESLFDKIIELLLIYSENSFDRLSLFAFFLSELVASSLQTISHGKLLDFVIILNSNFIEAEDSDICKLKKCSSLVFI